MQRHEIRALKYSDRQSTNVEPRYQPVYDVDDHTARTLEEIAVINRFEPGAIWSDIRGGRLNELLNEISSRAGASGHFRNGSVGTALDSRGQAIVYPSCKNIPSQIAALNAWLIANQDYPIACAAVTMNVIFNMHPFDDRNGRCGRILFNLLCATNGTANRQCRCTNCRSRRVGNMSSVCALPNIAGTGCRSSTRSMHSHGLRK